jgi:photosystem II stability/assembly factor-like uncharacterized protein
VRQLKVEHRTTVAGFHDEAFGITVGYGGAVYYTMDGGETWTEANNDSWCRFGLDIVDENVAWHIGNGGQVRVSTDGGRNWEAVSDLSDKGISPSTSFLDTKTGWAASPGQLWATSDGGQMWTDVTLPEMDNLIAAIALRTAADGYVLDYAGNLHVTHDGGSTWVSQTLELGDKIDLVAHPVIRFFDAENGVIVTRLAEKGIVALRTADGGITWTQEDLLDDLGIYLYLEIYLYLSRDGRFLTITAPNDSVLVLHHN